MLNVCVCEVTIRTKTRVSSNGAAHRLLMREEREFGGQEKKLLRERVRDSMGRKNNRVKY